MISDFQPAEIVFFFKFEIGNLKCCLSTLFVQALRIWLEMAEAIVYKTVISDNSIE